LNARLRQTCRELAPGEDILDDDLLEGLVRISSADDATALLANRPDAISEDIVAQFSAITARARDEGNQSLAELLSARLRLLTRAQQVGPERAVREYFRGQAPPPVQVRDRWATIELDAAMYVNAHDAEALQRAVYAAHELAADAATIHGSDHIRRFVFHKYAVLLGETARVLGSIEASQEGMSLLARVIELESPGSAEEAFLRLEYAQALAFYGQLSGAQHSVHEAAALAEEALSSIPQDDLGRQQALSQAAAVLRDLYEITGDLALLDRRIELLRPMLRDPHTPADTLAAVRCQLGNAYADLYERTEDPADLAHAINLLERGIERPGPHVREASNNLATCLRARLRFRPSMEDSNRALQIYLDLIANTEPTAIAYSGYVNNYGRLLMEVYELGGEQGYLDEAIAALNAAVDFCPSGSPDRPGYLGNLASAMARESRRAPADMNKRSATVEAYWRAIGAAEPVSQELTLDIQLGLAQYTLELHEWSIAADVMARARNTLTELLSRQSTRGHQEMWLRQTQGLAAARALAHVMLGETAQAAVAIESSQGVLLQEGTGTAAGAANNHAATAALIADASRGRTLVYLAHAVDTGLAVTVRDGIFRWVLLPELSPTKVDAVLADARLDLAVSPSEFDVGLQQVVDFLARAVVDPLRPSLQPPVTIIAVGSLATLPLTLAGSGGPLIELGAVGFAASARLLRSPQPLPQTPTVLGVAEPRPSDAPSLPGALAEMDVIQLRHACEVLTGPEATRGAVLGRLRHVDVAHLATHTHIDLHTPVESGLVLAHDEHLTLRDVFAAPMAARLVILSACESALPGSPLPDEIVSLPSGLLHAGATGVIGSMWPVADTATAVLMTEIWRRIGDGQGPNEALTSSQMWLRDLTRAHAADWCSQPHVPASVATLVAQWLRQENGDLPFKRPRWWGGFAYSGT
jgi:CHAT domain-containing protein